MLHVKALYFLIFFLNVFILKLNTHHKLIYPTSNILTNKSLSYNNKFWNNIVFCHHTILALLLFLSLTASYFSSEVSTTSSQTHETKPTFGTEIVTCLPRPHVTMCKYSYIYITYPSIHQWITKSKIHVKCYLPSMIPHSW